MVVDEVVTREDVVVVVEVVDEDVVVVDIVGATLNVKLESMLFVFRLLIS